MKAKSVDTGIIYEVPLDQWVTIIHSDGKQYGMHLSSLIFLDPPEEREIGSHGIKYLARKVGELEDKLSKLSTGLDKVYKELSEEIEKLSACVSSELTEEVNNEKK